MGDPSSLPVNLFCPYSDLSPCLRQGFRKGRQISLRRGQACRSGGRRETNGLNSLREVRLKSVRDTFTFQSPSVTCGITLSLTRSIQSFQGLIRPSLDSFD